MAAEYDRVISSVPGDTPARCRMVVHELSGVRQRALIWALRSRHYSAASSAALAFQASALTPLDAAAVTTLAGSTGANVVAHTSLAAAPTPVVSTGVLTHRGTHRVWARVYSPSSAPPSVRLVWDVGDLGGRRNENASVALPGVNNWYLLDLGEVRLDPVGTGTHQWGAAIQAQGQAAGDDIYIDRIWVLPVDEGYGVLRAEQIGPGLLDTYIARDAFNQSAGVLNGKTTDNGVAWTTAGDATDLSVDGTNHYLTRSVAAATNGRWAIAGSSTYTDIAAIVDVRHDSALGGNNSQLMGLHARYTDANNYLFGGLVYNDSTGVLLARVRKTVAGTPTTLAEATLPAAYVRYLLDAGIELALQVTTGGFYTLLAYNSSGFDLQPVVAGQDSALATGGVLATGKHGIYDANFASATSGRIYDNFSSWVPTIDAVLQANRSAEMRFDGMATLGATSDAWSPVTSVIGDLPRLPPSGMEDRPTELIVLTSRGDLDTLPDVGIDSITADVHGRATYLFRP